MGGASCSDPSRLGWTPLIFASFRVLLNLLVVSQLASRGDLGPCDLDERMCSFMRESGLVRARELGREFYASRNRGSKKTGMSTA